MQGEPLPVTAMLLGQAIAGNCTSVTVTVKEQFFVKPAPSVAFHTTVFVPLGKAEPETKPLVFITVGGGEQLSEAVGVAYVATALHRPASVFRLWLLGQVMVGACVSFTVMRKVHVFVRPAASVAFQVTMVMPFGKGWPLARPLTRVIEPPVQLSVNVGVE